MIANLTTVAKCFLLLSLMKMNEQSKFGPRTDGLDVDLFIYIKFTYELKYFCMFGRGIYKYLHNIYMLKDRLSSNDKEPLKSAKV